MTGTKSLLFPGHLLSIVFFSFVFSFLCCVALGRKGGFLVFGRGVCYLEDEEGVG